MRKFIFVIALMIFISFISGCVAFEKQNKEESRTTELDKAINHEPVKIMNQSRGGMIKRDEVWSGEILITDTIEILRGVTLIIEPGTVVKFKHYRGYKDPNRLSFQILGTLKAAGTSENQIWFTSDADKPVNGDWSMLRFIDAGNGSIIKYAIIEFGQQGINMWNSSPAISHSIVRWNNWEGIYLESYSRPIIEYNRIYQNGYNGIAMEQFNNAIVRYNYISRSGTNGIHIDASTALVENNMVEENANGLSVDDSGTLYALNNTLKNNRGAGIMCGEGENKLNAAGNSFSGNVMDISCSSEMVFENVTGIGTGEVIFDYPDVKRIDLGYTPGDARKDEYVYVYPDDESRRIVKKIGEGLGLTWSVAWDGTHVWTAAL